MDAVLQHLVWHRARSCCEYCHVPAEIALLPFQIDHIIAEKHGGPTTAEKPIYAGRFNMTERKPVVAERIDL